MKKTAKHKYAMIGFIYLLGLICASFLESTACFLLFLVSGLVFLFMKRKRNDFTVVCIGVISVSFLVMGFYGRFYVEKAYMLDGKTSTVEGTVTEVLAPDNDTVLLTVSGTADGTPVSFTLFASDTGIKTGDRIKFSAKFIKLTDNAEFSQVRYYYSKGIFLRAYPRGEIEIVSGSFNLYHVVSALSDYFKGQTDRVLDGDESGIIKALFFGDKSSLSEELSVSVKRSGISHLTAVSGTHLTLIIHLIAMVFSKVIKRKSLLSTVLFILIVIFLMMFFGMTASVMRSGFMLSAVYGAQLFRRRPKIVNSVGVALLFILIPSPYACCDIGLWMSVLGTLGVSVVSDRVNLFLRKRLSKRPGKELVAAVCAFMCTLPVGMFAFGGISLVSFFTGIITVPLFSAILILVLLSVLSLGLLSYPLLLAAGVTAKVMNKIILFMGNLRYAYIETDESLTALFAVLFITAFSATLITSRKIRYIIRLTAFSAAALVMSALITEIIEFNNIKISVYSDGNNPLVAVEDKKGISFYTISDSIGVKKKITECSAGKNKSFLCVAGSTENNTDVFSDSEFLSCHFPDFPPASYDIGGEYTAEIKDNVIILYIRGITVAVLPIEDASPSHIGIYGGYSKSSANKGNSATILCDKRFYNCNDEINAYYNKTEIIINGDGKYYIK